MSHEETNRKAHRGKFLLVQYKPFNLKVEFSRGTTLEMAEDGFSFEMQDFSYSIGDVLEINLCDPDSELTIPVVGEIVWKKEGWYKCKMGIVFKEIADSARESLLPFISTTCKMFPEQTKSDDSSEISSGNEPISPSDETFVEEVDQLNDASANEHEISTGNIEERDVAIKDEIESASDENIIKNQDQIYIQQETDKAQETSIASDNDEEDEENTREERHQDEPVSGSIEEPEELGTPKEEFRESLIHDNEPNGFEMSSGGEAALEESSDMVTAETDNQETDDEPDTVHDTLEIENNDISDDNIQEYVLAEKELATEAGPEVNQEDAFMEEAGESEQSIPVEDKADNQIGDTFSQQNENERKSDLKDSTLSEEIVQEQQHDKNDKDVSKDIEQLNITPQDEEIDKKSGEQETGEANHEKDGQDIPQHSYASEMTSYTEDSALKENETDKGEEIIQGNGQQTYYDPQEPELTPKVDEFDRTETVNIKKSQAPGIIKPKKRPRHRKKPFKSNTRIVSQRRKHKGRHPSAMPYVIAAVISIAVSAALMLLVFKYYDVDIKSLTNKFAWLDIDGALTTEPDYEDAGIEDGEKIMDLSANEVHVPLVAGDAQGDDTAEDSEGAGEPDIVEYVKHEYLDKIFTFFESPNTTEQDVPEEINMGTEPDDPDQSGHEVTSEDKDPVNDIAMINKSQDNVPALANNINQEEKEELIIPHESQGEMEKDIKPPAARSKKVNSKRGEILVAEVAVSQRNQEKISRVESSSDKKQSQKPDSFQKASKNVTSQQRRKNIKAKIDKTEGRDNSVNSSRTEKPAPVKEIPNQKRVSHRRRVSPKNFQALAKQNNHISAKQTEKENNEQITSLKVMSHESKHSADKSRDRLQKQKLQKTPSIPFQHTNYKISDTQRSNHAEEKQLRTRILENRPVNKEPATQDVPVKDAGQYAVITPSATTPGKEIKKLIRNTQQRKDNKAESSSEASVVNDGTQIAELQQKQKIPFKIALLIGDGKSGKLNKHSTGNSDALVAEWENIGKTRNGFQVFVNEAFPDEQSQDKITLMIRNTIGIKDFTGKIMLDCRKNRVRILEEHGGRNPLLYIYSKDWQEILPESMPAIVYNAKCAGR